MVTTGDLAEKKIEWVANGPHQKFVKEELAGVDAAAGQGQDKVEAQLSPLEKELEEGKPARKRKSGDLPPAKAETPTREGKTRKKKSDGPRVPKRKSQEETGLAVATPIPPRIRPSQRSSTSGSPLIRGTRKVRERKKRRRTSLQTADHSGQAPESPPLTRCSFFGKPPPLRAARVSNSSFGSIP